MFNEEMLIKTRDAFICDVARLTAELKISFHQCQSNAGTSGCEWVQAAIQVEPLKKVLEKKMCRLIKIFSVTLSR